MNQCEKYATICAKKKGMTYSQAIKKYPKSCYKNSVYKNDVETHESHCVHCARAEVLLRGKDL